MSARSKSDKASLAIGLRKLALGRPEMVRAVTSCDVCGFTPADLTPVMTGREDGTLCRGCWWRANFTNIERERGATWAPSL